MSVLARPRPVRPRNDLRQYDDLADEWWRPGGAFAMLHWIAKARAALVPPARRPGAVLVDIGCGAGLLAPHVAGKGYTHVGVDLTASALAQAAAHGVRAVRGDATALPLPDGCADVVSAGELFEHVPDLPAAVREACRVLRPGGVLVADTLNATRAARWVAVTLGERLPGGAPPGIHDPTLFVPPARLVAECAAHGIPLRVRGLRPATGPMLRWLATRRGEVPMVPTRSTAVLYQAWGVRTAGRPAGIHRPDGRRR
jgi:2-polyprenyl-6-hydroxyphenyl methylase/3-demethylubiquinone-9 3-methyltransferase